MHILFQYISEGYLSDSMLTILLLLFSFTGGLLARAIFSVALDSLSLKILEALIGEDLLVRAQYSYTSLPGERKSPENFKEELSASRGGVRRLLRVKTLLEFLELLAALVFTPLIFLVYGGLNLGLSGDFIVAVLVLGPALSLATLIALYYFEDSRWLKTSSLSNNSMLSKKPYLAFLSGNYLSRISSAFILPICGVSFMVLNVATNMSYVKNTSHVLLLFLLMCMVLAIPFLMATSISKPLLDNPRFRKALLGVSQELSSSTAPYYNSIVSSIFLPFYVRLYKGNKRKLCFDFLRGFTYSDPKNGLVRTHLEKSIGNSFESLKDPIDRFRFLALVRAIADTDRDLYNDFAHSPFMTAYVDSFNFLEGSSKGPLTEQDETDKYYAVFLLDNLKTLLSLPGGLSGIYSVKILASVLGIEDPLLKERIENNEGSELVFSKLSKEEISGALPAYFLLSELSSRGPFVLQEGKFIPARIESHFKEVAEPLSLLIEEMMDSEEGPAHVRRFYLENRITHAVREKISEVDKDYDPHEDLEILEEISDKIDESEPFSLVEILLFRMRAYRFYSEINKDFLALPKEMKETLVESQVT